MPTRTLVLLAPSFTAFTCTDLRHRTWCCLMDYACALQVFLDVDDLKSIGDLEVYIEESEVIMIFLSKGCMLQGFKHLPSDSMH